MVNNIFYIPTVDGKTKMFTIDWWPHIIKYSHIILYNIFGRYVACTLKTRRSEFAIAAGRFDRDSATATRTGWYCRTY